MSVRNEVISTLVAPERIRTALGRLCEAAAKLAKPPRSIAVMGAIAKGRFREGQSDVDLLFVVDDASAAALEALGGPFRDANRLARLDPIVLTVAELKDAADVFPTKFLSLQRHHRVIFGDDLFAQLSISREHLRLRVEQELRNLSLRLRRRYLAIGQDEALVARALAEAAPPLESALESLLTITGTPGPSAFTAAAQSFGLDAAALGALERREFPDAVSLFAKVLDAIDRAAAIADRAQAGPGAA